MYPKDIKKEKKKVTKVQPKKRNQIMVIFVFELIRVPKQTHVKNNHHPIKINNLIKVTFWTVDQWQIDQL